MGLWRLAGEKKYPGPSFDTWQQDKPVRLLSLQSGQLSREIDLTPDGRNGIFTFCSLPEQAETGVFLQNGKVVGWTFGDTLKGAYMWTMGPDTDLENEITVEDFYNQTFAGGREDYISRALELRDTASPLVQLQMFTEGYWFPKKLTPDNTPAYLRPEKVIPYIVQLVKYILEQESYSEIAMLADENILQELKNPDLLIYVAKATQQIYGTEAAVNFLEGPGGYIRQAIADDTTDLDRFHLDLYRQWLNTIMETGDSAKGWQVFNRARNIFRESPVLNLLGVELALDGGDWETAESLLYERKFPPELKERMTLLANRISTMKGRENQIVINFTPGSTEIPATATVNDEIDQDFLVDTGASFVTIPYSTIEFLGLENLMSEEQKEVKTAGGSIYANVVTLDTIKLQGWTEKNIQALVIDLPDRPGIGLLGLNFIHRFRMDLQPDEGVLILEPQ